jgi:hypothetical protein
MTAAKKRKKLPQVTFHAIDRYRERTGCTCPDKAKKDLLSIAGQVKPVAMKRLANGDVFLFPTDHFCCGKWILIIKDDQIVTCFKAGKDQYLPQP